MRARGADQSAVVVVLRPHLALLFKPANNVFAHPGDTIYDYSEPQTFLAFRASGAQGQFKFEAWRISLVEAVAKTAGLKDEQADPAFVFLYRGETREVAEQLGVDCSKFSGPIIPVIYNINLRDPAGYFLAADFEVRNKDVIFVANAASVDRPAAYSGNLSSLIGVPVARIVMVWTITAGAVVTSYRIHIRLV